MNDNTVRLTYQQYRAARKPVHRCCNYDKGSCLVLECVCVQSISYSLICRWFRAMVKRGADTFYTQPPNGPLTARKKTPAGVK